MLRKDLRHFWLCFIRTHSQKLGHLEWSGHLLHMKTLRKGVGSYCTCSEVYDFSIGTLVWKVPDPLSMEYPLNIEYCVVQRILSD